MTGWWMSGRRGIAGAGTILTLLLAACGNSSADKPPLANHGPTVGDQATEVVDAICTRLYSDCQMAGWYGTDLASCEAEGYKSVCSIGDCASASITLTQEIDRCVSALQDFACVALATPDLPPECNGVVRVPAGP